MAHFLVFTCLFKCHVRVHRKGHTAIHATRTVTFTNTRNTAFRQQLVEKRPAFSLHCANEAPSVRMMCGPICVRDRARRFVFGDISTPLIDCLQWRADEIDHVCTFPQNLLSVFFACAMMYVLGDNFILLRRKRVYYFRQGRSCLTVSLFHSKTNCPLLKYRNTARPKTLCSYVTDTFCGQTVY